MEATDARGLPEADGGGRTPVRHGAVTLLRDLGYDEIWLQNWLAGDPGRLGLGEVTVIAQELTQARGGSLDILAADGDTYYSVEVQLGEVDASHGFRVFDYWARNRERYPGKTHVAVLVAESARGRYRGALEAIAEYLPLIVIELRSWRGEAEAVVFAEPVLANESLDTTASASIGTARTEADWRSHCSDDAWSFHETFVRLARESLGEVRVDYSPKSYIGVRHGRRVWAPLWPTRDGARTYLPDPDGSREEDASIAFERFSSELAEHGLTLAWTANYNAGSNPISVTLREEHLQLEPLRELLAASFEILSPNVTPWSERNPVAGPDDADA
jgi:hypothetical protein